MGDYPEKQVTEVTIGCTNLTYNPSLGIEFCSPKQVHQQKERDRGIEKPLQKCYSLGSFLHRTGRRMVVGRLSVNICQD